jgi:hypothetical protein
MGTIKKGILGGFSGKVGTVVGSSWKGIAYMRSLPLSVKNPRTLAQVSQRSKFTLVLRLLQPLNEFLRSGWKLYAHRRSPINAAMAYTLANAVAGKYPDYEIIPGKVLVSRGTLTPVASGFVSCSDGQVEFQWEDNSGKGSAKATDKALIAIINLAKDEAVTITAGAPRLDCTQKVTVPAEWLGDDVHAYIGFISEDGKEVANSVYLGNIVVA